MGADNWRVCPKCEENRLLAIQKNRLLAIQKQAEKITAAYGKVSPEEYMKLVIEAANPPDPELTLREDYEIGVYNGVFKVSYGCHCQTCNFNFEFDHKVLVYPEKK